jgi:predicted lipoprotein with Yx(FWY)xxD motif
MGAVQGRLAGLQASRGWAAVVPAAAVVAMVAAGCSSGGGGAHASSSPGAASGAASVVVKAFRSKLGMILTDTKGRAVYLFEKDTGPRSSCYGACATAWPPLVGHPVAGSGVQAALLGTVRRANGSSQVTYAGHPLYYFASDQQPGDISGEGSQAFGGGWDLVSPAGTKVEKPGG